MKIRSASTFGGRAIVLSRSSTGWYWLYADTNEVCEGVFSSATDAAKWERAHCA